MKSFLVFALLCVIAVKSDNVCYTSTINACTGDVGGAHDLKCNTLFGGFHTVSESMKKYALDQLKQSYEYLLFATYFGNYEKNRPGFKKLFSELSDKMWDNSISLIKHTSKRGSKMVFPRHRSGQTVKPLQTIEISEIEAMAYALDTQKELAHTAHEIHFKATGRDIREPEVSAYLEENFLHQQANTIRTLAGYSNDLKNLYRRQNDISLSVHLFDQYIAKV